MRNVNLQPLSYVSSTGVIFICNALSKSVNDHGFCIPTLEQLNRWTNSDMTYNKDNNLMNAKKMAIDEQTLILTEQNGKKDLGWNDAEFW